MLINVTQIMNSERFIIILKEVKKLYNKNEQNFVWSVIQKY